MLIRDWFFRLYGDVAHDWRFITVLAVIVLLICWLSAEGVISVGHRAERWIQRRSWNRSAKRAARDPRPPVDEPQAPPDPLAAEIEALFAGAEQECRQHAERRDA